ncbi:MAG: 16S rRNA (uracil(1498)-N(3))-methyltransferase [Clostridia bacterium]|nr:16S rRNA (uracil(1498)-N(3))-methyltransferase [Clostridia bacterium]
MFNFFTDNASINGKFNISGSDFNHIKNVLRMKIGEKFLVSHGGASHLCELESFESDFVVAKIFEENYQDTSLPIEIYLFQGLPKADKLELIIQKTVELGVHEIIPVEMKRSIVKLDEKKKDSKTTRWQAIAESAAKQSKRTAIPTVQSAIPYTKALEMSKDLDLLLIPYESKNGMTDTANALKQIKAGMKVGVIIGPEGGFEESEIQKAEELNGKAISLGKRILRTETAAIATITMLMLYSEMSL